MTEVPAAADNSPAANGLTPCIECGALVLVGGIAVHIELGIVKGVRCPTCSGTSHGLVELFTDLGDEATEESRRRGGGAATLQLERIEGQSVTGWGRWHVLGAGGELVGIVLEDHEWTGTEYGPAHYDVAHNPTGGDWEALWRSEGHSTPQEALKALVEHLAADSEA